MQDTNGVLQWKLVQLWRARMWPAAGKRSWTTPVFHLYKWLATLSSELNLFCFIHYKFAQNISKTKSIILGSSFKLFSMPTLRLYLSGEPVQLVDKVKLLGVKIDSWLSWIEQIDTTVMKMGNGISMARECLPYVPARILGQVVTSCHLDYCSPVWSSASESVQRKLQIAQNRAARLVLNCPIRTNTDRMHCNSHGYEEGKSLP